MLVDVTEEHLTVWAEELAALTEGSGGLFARPEPREVFADLVDGLSAGLGRVNGWTLSARAGHATPDRVQKFLNAASWSADELRDRVREYALAGIGAPEATVVLDDTQVQGPPLPTTAAAATHSPPGSGPGNTPTRNDHNIKICCCSTWAAELDDGTPVDTTDMDTAAFMSARASMFDLDCITCPVRQLSGEQMCQARGNLRSRVKRVARVLCETRCLDIRPSAQPGSRWEVWLAGPSGEYPRPERRARDRPRWNPMAPGTRRATGAAEHPIGS